MSLRDKILAANDHTVTPLDVPEWGETVYLRSWTGAERNRITRLWQKGEHHMDEAYSLILTSSLCDAEGKRLFKEADGGALMDKKSAVLEKIVFASLHANGVNAEAVDAAKKN